MRLALFLLLPLALSGCVLDAVDAGYVAATGQHIDAHWYDPLGQTVYAGQVSSGAAAGPVLGCDQVGCR
jgi:hypothetical protein